MHPKNLKLFYKLIMNKIFFSFFLVCYCYTSIAQSAVGLIAHWDMNGTANDVSGNGHNGHANNLTPAIGLDGVMGHAYFFNGINSSMTVPYSPQYDVTKFSICATFKIEGYYNGTCQSNYIIARGHNLSSGNWSLLFDDNAYNDCSTLDTNQEVFLSTAGTNTPLSSTGWQCTRKATENSWLRVVMTYDSVNWKVYVNDTLVNSVPGNSSPIGISNDSIEIGAEEIFSFGYPYWFHGTVDDIRLYKTALTDSQIIHLNDTCGTITAEPATSSTHVGGNASYTVNTSITGAAYQWQQDGGTGYVNLTNSGPYSGVYTNTLTITGVTAAITGDHYRCLISNSWGCADTTVQALLTTEIQNINLDEMVRIYPNPTDDKVNICLKNIANNCSYKLMNELGQKLILQEINENITHVDLSKLPSGIYFLKVQIENQFIYKKIFKY